MHRCVPFLAWAAVAATPVRAADPPASQRHTLTARASEVDPRARPHPEIGFIFEKDGRPQDVQHASVDPRVPLQGKLVIWLMGHNEGLFERLNSYGLHAIQVHYANQWFGTSHVLDTGWSGDHYCRSWELLGLHRFGPIVTVDTQSTPYTNSRRLISNADVRGDEKRAHNAVTPGSSSPKAPDGSFLYEPVWKYLFTHPVDLVGEAVDTDPRCEKFHPLGG